MVISHNPEQLTFSATSGDVELGVLSYQRLDHALDLRHTVVEPQAEGRGVGSALVRAALDVARSEHLSVIPTCWFVGEFVAKHPEYEDLLER